jgi:adhesin/invasin
MNAWGAQDFSGVVAGDTVSLHVVVRDASGAPVAGIEIRWGVNAGGGSFSNPTTITASNGVATGVLSTARRVMWNNATAASAAAPGALVGFSAKTVAGTPSAGATTLLSSAATLPADATSTTRITVRLLDPNDNPVNRSGGSVTLQATLGRLSDVVDFGNGTYLATLTAGRRAGTATITGSLGSNALSRSATVEIRALAASRIGPAGATTRTLVAGASTALRIAASDSNDNAVGGVRITWTVGAGSLSNASSTTGPDGGAETTLASQTRPASYTVTATSPGLTGSPLTFRVDAVVGTPAGLAFQNPASFQDIPAGSSPTLRVRVADANGNAVAGADVVWSTTGTGTFSSAKSATDVTGNASVALKTTKTPASSTITASNGTRSATLPIRTVPVYTIKVAGTPASGVPAGNDTTLKVNITDQNGAPAPGIRVTWAVNAGNGALSWASSLSAANGIATTNLTTGTKAGTNKVTVTNASLSGSPITISVATVAGDPAEIRFSSLTTSATTESSIAAKVEILDAFGNVAPRPGQVVLTLGAGPSRGRTGPIRATAVAGVATFEGVRFDRPGTYRLIASYNGLQASSGAIEITVPASMAEPTRTDGPKTLDPGAAPYFVDHLDATRLRNGSVRVNWTTPRNLQHPVGGFLVWRALASYALVAELDGGAHDYVDISAPASDAPRYAVTLFYDSGQGYTEAEAAMDGLSATAQVPSSANASAAMHASSLGGPLQARYVWPGVAVVGTAALALGGAVAWRRFRKRHKPSPSTPAPD